MNFDLCSSCRRLSGAMLTFPSGPKAWRLLSKLDTTSAASRDSCEYRWQGRGSPNQMMERSSRREAGARKDLAISPIRPKAGVLAVSEA